MAMPTSGRSRAVVLVAPLGPAREALGAVLAHHGLQVAWLEPSGASAAEKESSVLDTDNLAALGGTLFVGGSSPGPVGVLGLGPGVWPAITLARSMPDIVGALAVFSDEDLEKDVLDVGLPVQAHLRAAVAAGLNPPDGTRAEVIGYESVPTMDDLATDSGTAAETVRHVADFLGKHAGGPPSAKRSRHRVSE